MAEKRHEGGVSYHIPGKDYFEKRELRRHAGVFALWALGVGAVISGDFSGWNLGFNVGGWGGMFVATIIYRHHVSRPHLLHRRDEPGAAAYRRRLFVRADGVRPVGRVHHRHCREHRICADAGGDHVSSSAPISRRFLERPARFQPVWWVIGYIIFVGLNARGVELSFTVTVIVTLLAIAILLIFLLSAIPLSRFWQVCHEYRSRSGDGSGRGAA